MNQIRSIIILRIRQVYRYLDEIGFGIIAVALFILTGVIFNALKTILAINAVNVLFFVTALLFWVELRRKDIHFLKSIFQSPLDFTYFKLSENLLIVFPFILFHVYFRNWWIIAGMFTISGIMALLPIHRLQPQQMERKRELSFLPLSLFEFKFYIEKRKFAFTLLFIVMCLGAIHISLWILGAFILCMMPVDIFTPQEPNEMINYESNFLAKKIVRNAVFILGILTLPTLLTIITDPSVILILSYGILANLVALTLAISKKYASYFGVNPQNSATTSTAILTIIMLLPGGILITLGASIYYYLKAENNMKHLYA